MSVRTDDNLVVGDKAFVMKIGRLRNNLPPY